MKHLAAAALIAAGPALANECGSRFQATESIFETVLDMGDLIACSAGEDLADCTADYERAVTTMRSSYARFDQSRQGPGKIGPRLFMLDPDDDPRSGRYTGTVLTERLFIGAPILGARFRYDVRVTGGRSTRRMTIRVCLIDPATNRLAAPRFLDEVTLRRARDHRGRTVISGSFSGATGLIPMVLLDKRDGLNGYRYTLTVREEGRPAQAGS